MKGTAQPNKAQPAHLSLSPERTVIHRERNPQHRWPMDPISPLLSLAAKRTPRPRQRLPLRDPFLPWFLPFLPINSRDEFTSMTQWFRPQTMLS